MIVEEAHRRLAVRADEVAASFEGDYVRVEQRPASAPAAERPKRMVIEFDRRVSGIGRPRALLGGCLTPAHAGSVEVLVSSTESTSVDPPATCPSLLSSTPLIPGLLDDFAPGVLAGLRSVPTLPAGRLVIDRAAYDPATSSSHAFQMTAQALATLLAHEGDDLETVIRRWLRSA